MNSRDKKDEDEEGEFVPYAGLEKGVVLQEKRLFNETPVDPKKCGHLLTKLFYLITQGEEFTRAEATDTFFAITKLFQSKDMYLRRLVFLALKELATKADDVIIIISSLTKDMNSKTDLYRANAIRCLCSILVDITMLGQGERYLKQAIVDKEAYVASAALVSGVHLYQTPTNTDLVKRWFNEIQDAAKSKSSMVQYHALGLLYQIKQQDRLAVSKLVSTMIRGNVRSPHAHCLLIRITVQVMEEDTNASNDRTFYEYLESCLRHKSDMVEFEAARAICSLKNITPRDLIPSISVLQVFLSSSRPTLRFAAVRTLNKVAMTYPLSVTTCNLDMENLITDVNRSVATLAITTLLKTGSESSVDRLMKQISTFMSDISDEFKIVVVQAIRSLCLKFPAKHRTMMNFLSSILRDEGGYEYKKAVVNALLTIIEEIPGAKETGLTHLCEFIEDCEYTSLSTKILNVLGKEGPSTNCPSRFIRYIYNRVILENATVRAASVSALAKFGIHLIVLRPSIVILLKRCMHDTDDEVRDRATFYLKMLEQEPDGIQKLIDQDLGFDLESLEQTLQEYIASPSLQPFDITKVPKEAPKRKKAPEAAQKKDGTVAKSEAQAVAASNNSQAEALAAIPQFADFGELFRSTKPFELTEPETEYVVNCVKHIFPAHIVLQFNCTNTIEESQLENVVIKLESDDFPVELEVPAEKLVYQVPSVTYVAVSRPEGENPTGTISATMKFTMKEVDPSNGDVSEDGVEDDYKLMDLEVTLSDYMKKTFVSNFQEKWTQIGDAAEVVETYALSSIKSLSEAIKEIVEFLGMQPCEKSETIPEGKSKHILYLSGLFSGGVEVLARGRMILDPTTGVNLELTVRSTDEGVSVAVAGAL